MLVISTILCLATLTLWVRSHWRGDRWSFIAFGHLHSLSTNYGGIYYHRWTPYGQSWLWSTFPHHPEYQHGATPRRWMGVQLVYMARDGGRTITIVSFWLIALLFAIPSLMRLAGLFQTRRSKPGACPTCGYDLRATLDRCPECGVARGVTS